MSKKAPILVLMCQNAKIQTLFQERFESLDNVSLINQATQNKPYRLYRLQNNQPDRMTTPRVITLSGSGVHGRGPSAVVYI